MILYYDKFYKLKEEINDKDFNKGNDNVNFIYVYIEDNEDNYTNFVIQYEMFSESDNPLVSKTYYYDEIINDFQIPFSTERDLKYFNYGTKYKVIKFKVPNGDDGSENILENNGVVKATIRLINVDSIQSLGIFTFCVKEGIVSNAKNITESQFDYLLKVMSKRNNLWCHMLDLTISDGYETQNIYVSIVNVNPSNITNESFDNLFTADTNYHYFVLSSMFEFIGNYYIPFKIVFNPTNDTRELVCYDVANCNLYTLEIVDYGGDTNFILV